jgi:hypothetical protein
MLWWFYEVSDNKDEDVRRGLDAIGGRQKIMLFGGGFAENLQVYLLSTFFTLRSGHFSEAIFPSNIAVIRNRLS